MNRIQNINDAIARECLAERTHIYVDWLAVMRGERAAAFHSLIGSTDL